MMSRPPFPPLGRPRFPPALALAGIFFAALANVRADDPLAELQAAEQLYSEAVARAMIGGGTEDEVKARVRKVNGFYIKKLEALADTHRGSVSEGLAKILVRLDDMKGRVHEDISLEATDGRIRTGGATARDPAKDLLPVEFLRTPRAGSSVRHGDDVELSGRVRNLPDGWVARFFGSRKASGVYFPLGSTMTNGKFEFSWPAFSGWTGEVVFAVLMMPQDLMDDIDAWNRDRIEWERRGAPMDDRPLLRGAVSGSLDRGNLEEAGCIFLATWECVFVPG